MHPWTAGRAYLVALPRSIRDQPREVPPAAGSDSSGAGPPESGRPHAGTGTGGRPILHSTGLDPQPRPGLLLGAALGLVAVLGYAWWATGVHPFTVGAYVAVGIPMLIAASLALGPSRSPRVTPVAGPDAEDDGRSSPGRAAPWVVILVASLSLEAVALALGGRSAVVPTLSTVVDHALRWHPVRLLMFCGWLSIGVVPTVRAVLQKRRRAV